jgi:hypothetical protein
MFCSFSLIVAWQLVAGSVLGEACPTVQVELMCASASNPTVMDGKQRNSVIAWNVGSFDFLDDRRMLYPILVAKTKGNVTQVFDRHKRLIVRSSEGPFIARKWGNGKYFNVLALDLARERSELLK